MPAQETLEQKVRANVKDTTKIKRGVFKKTPLFIYPHLICLNTYGMSATLI